MNKIGVGLTGIFKRPATTALNDDSIAIYWIMIDEKDENPIGSISALKEWSDWNAGYYWWIQSMYVIQEERGKGHAITLIDTVENEMKNQNGLELRLYVHKHNEKAIRAYEKAGFENAQYEIMVRKNDH